MLAGIIISRSITKKFIRILVKLGRGREAKRRRERRRGRDTEIERERERTRAMRTKCWRQMRVL